MTVMRTELRCPVIKGLAWKVSRKFYGRALQEPCFISRSCPLSTAAQVWASQASSQLNKTHAPFLNTRTMAATAAATLSTPTAGPIRLAIIGDVHSHWYEDDAEALESLGVDAALFIGDFGEEAIGLTRRVADVCTPKAVILGNHDAWYSLTAWARNKWIMSGAARGDALYAGVTKQLEILGEDHVGYRGKAFRAASGTAFSVVGARPFSKGGNSWTEVAEFYRHNYQVEDFGASADRIAKAVLSQPRENTVIVAAHNGPSGLGSCHHDICGADFRPKAGDHGDPDVEMALQHVEAAGGHVPLVTFGHMHESLKFGKKLRNMIEIHQDTGTVYLNTAVVPRIRHMKVPALSQPDSNGDSNVSSPDEALAAGQGSAAITARQFTVAEVTDGLVSSVSSVWVGRRGRRGDFEVVARETLLETLPEQAGQGNFVRRKIWRGFDRVWETMVTRRRTSENVQTPVVESDTSYESAASLLEAGVRVGQE